MRGPLRALQPPLPLDHNAEAILRPYAGLPRGRESRHTFLGHSLLATLSQELGDRRPNACSDMDFWSNHGQSVYRPNLTLAELRARPNFTYRSGFLASRFAELDDNTVSVTGSRLEDDAGETWTARALVLAAGSLGTTRLVLRSLGLY